MTEKVKLLDQVRAVARARHLSHRTEDTYHNFIKLDFIQIKRQSRAYLSMYLEMSGVFLSSPIHFPMFENSETPIKSASHNQLHGEGGDFFFIPNGTSDFQFSAF